MLEPQRFAECLEIGVTGYYGIVVVRLLDQGKQTVVFRGGGEKNKKLMSVF